MFNSDDPNALAVSKERDAQDVLAGRKAAVFHPATELEAQIIVDILMARGYRWLFAPDSRRHLYRQCVEKGMIAATNQKILFGHDAGAGQGLVLRGIDLPLSTPQLFALLAERQDKANQETLAKLDKIQQTLDRVLNRDVVRPIAKTLHRPKPDGKA